MPYTSYFSNAQSVSDQWSLSLNQAKKVYEVWDLVYKALKNNYTNALTEDAEGFFKQKLAVYSDPTKMKSYKSWDAVISEDQFKNVVDIQRALLLFRAFYSGGQKQKAQANYKWLWESVKGRMGGDADEAEKLATKFNTTYCPDELWHYFQYLAKSDKPPSELMKPWVSVDQDGNMNLRVWYKRKAA